MTDWQKQTLDFFLHRTDGQAGHQGKTCHLLKIIASSLLQPSAHEFHLLDMLACHGTMVPRRLLVRL